jgi:hypothetical protein
MENYFNYFTEIEEKFRQCRSEPVLLSPLDWALVEAWKEQDFPLEAVLTGIERSFEKFKAGKRPYRKVGSLAYCSQEVYRAVEESRTAAAQGGVACPAAKLEAPAPFSGDEIARFLAHCREALESASQQAHATGRQVLADEVGEIATALQELVAPDQATGDLEATERKLTALEEKLHATLLRGTAAEVLADLQAEVERNLMPYRRKMKPAEIDLLQRRFLRNRLFDHYKIPRLSLFYL